MPVEGHYITENDVDNWDASSTGSERQEIIDWVEDTVERITGDVFYPKTFHLFLDGNGKNQMFSKFKSKILSINKMAISEVGISTIDFTSTGSEGSSGAYTVTLTKTRVTEDYYKNDYIGLYDYSARTTGEPYWGSRIISNTATSTGEFIVTIDNALPITISTGDEVSIITNWDWNDNSIYRSKPVTISEPSVLNEPSSFYWDGKFPKGSRNIEVWGSYGWYSCPKSVKEAVIVLCRYENDNTLYTSYGEGFESEKLGDYSYKRIKDKSITGVSEADRLLKNYIRKKPILGVS